MSGITGFFSRTDKEIDPLVLERMVDVIAHRGPDGRGLFFDHPIGLGHRQLFTTPESLFEQQPIAQNGCIITADARIDNRDELGPLLGFSSTDLISISDAQLILYAYLKWGRDCTARLLGDFAFAIWDSKLQSLFCARDPFGVKLFYYTLTRDWFIFGSEIKTIFCHPDVLPVLNEQWLAEFFVPTAEITDYASTFFSGIQRLPPAHSLSISKSSDCFLKYWQLDPDRETYYPNPDDYAARLKEEFTQAVRRRLRSAYPVGSTLSGGLDSSSIACTARDILHAESNDSLNTYSAIFQDAPNADESDYIKAVVDQGGVNPHYLHPDRGTPFPDLEQVIRIFDEPFEGMNYFMPWAIYRSAHEHGVRVLLDGSDGDTTISHGLDYLDLLAMNRNWATFAKEVKAVTARYDNPIYTSIPKLAYSFAGPHMLEQARKGQWVSLIKDINKLGKLLNISRKNLFLNTGFFPLISGDLFRTPQNSQSVKRVGPDINPGFSPDFFSRLIKSNFFASRSNPQPQNMGKQNGRSYHYYLLTYGGIPNIVEWIGRLSSSHSVDLRFPFCDTKLVEYCLSMPPQYKLYDGWSRYAMRKAMQGTLPPQVQWRGGKISLDQVYPFMLQQHAVDYVREILEHPTDQITRFIDIPEIRNKFYSSDKEKGSSNMFTVWQTVVLDVWFRHIRVAC
jgi:asparagine synthase (glutamine-hydrolysing)